MSDLDLAIDISSIREAIVATTNLEDTWARMVQGVIAEERRLAAMSKATNDQVEQGYLRMMKKIDDEVQKQADLKARANQKAIQDYDKLLQRMDPVYRAAQNERAAIDALNKARAAGLQMTDQEYNQKLNLIQNTYRSADAFNQFGAKALWSGKNLGFFGQQVQQGGYQLQDFVVQVSNGTSFFTALGQQGSQFAGIFGPGGAVVGALIAVGAVVGGLAMKFYGVGKSFDDLAKEFQKSAENMEGSSKRLGFVFVNDLAGAIKTSNKELKNLLDTWNTLDKKAFNESSKAIVKSFGPTAKEGLSETSSRSYDVTRLQTIDSLVKTIGGTTRDEWLASIVDVNAAISKSTDLNTADKLILKEKIKTLTEQLGLQDAIDDASEKGIGTTRNLIAQYQIYGKTRTDQLEKERDSLVKQYGLMYDSKGITEDIIELNLAGAFDLAAGSASKIKDELLKAMSPAMVIAELLARANGGTGGLAQYVAQGVLNTNSGGRVPLAGGGPVAHWTMPAGSKPPPARPGDANLDGITDTDFNTKDPTKKGGGGNKKSGDDRIAALLREYDQKKRIAVLTGEQLKQEQARQEVIKALGDDVAKYSEDYIKAKTGEILKAQELIAVEEQRKHIYDTIESSMTDMFMSFADGTKSVKEAFSDMARSIIKELYQVLVVKQAVNAIMGFVGITNMPTVSTPTVVNDAVISPNGQIISTSPDDFLIATKNPQALAHNVSGGNTVNNDTGGVTVHQSFNISGSDAATVQRVLAQSMPAITAATKQAVIDSRRRGSSEMRGAFG